MTWYEWLYSTAYMPHGHCYLKDPITTWANVGTDALIAIVYTLIPIAIMYAKYKRGKHLLPQPVRYTIRLFALFVLCCGITHVFDIIVVWYPIYNLQAAWKALTALVSWLCLYEFTLAFKFIVSGRGGEVSRAIGAIKQWIADHEGELL